MPPFTVGMLLRYSFAPAYDPHKPSCTTRVDARTLNFTSPPHASRSSSRHVRCPPPHVPARVRRSGGRGRPLRPPPAPASCSASSSLGVGSSSLSPGLFLLGRWCFPKIRDSIAFLEKIVRSFLLKVRDLFVVHILNKHVLWWSIFVRWRCSNPKQD